MERLPCDLKPLLDACLGCEGAGQSYVEAHGFRQQQQ